MPTEHYEIKQHLESNALALEYQGNYGAARIGRVFGPGFFEQVVWDAWQAHEPQSLTAVAGGEN